MEEKKDTVTQTPKELQEVVQKILDVDAKAKKITSEALNTRNETEKTLAARKLELRENYLNRAKSRIEKMREEENRMAEEEIADAAKEHERLLQNLEEQYAAQKDGWIDAIFQQVIAR